MVDRHAGGSGGTPAQDLLDLLGPVDTFHDTTHLGRFGMPSGAMTEDMLAPVASAAGATRFGPLEKVHAFWFAGMSCDGCSVAVTGASMSSVIAPDGIPNLPRCVVSWKASTGPRRSRRSCAGVRPAVPV